MQIGYTYEDLQNLWVEIYTTKYPDNYKLYWSSIDFFEQNNIPKYTNVNLWFKSLEKNKLQKIYIKLEKLKNEWEKSIQKR